MKRAVLFMILSMVILSGYSQRIYFCEKYTDSGEPIGPATKLTSPAEGGYIYILYQNGSSNVTADKLFIYVDKLATSDYVPFDVKEMTVDKTKTWSAYDYYFASVGDYRVVVKDQNMKELSKEYIQLVLKEEESTSSSSSSDDDWLDYDDPTSMFYYTYSTIEACVGIDSYTGVPNTVSKSFSIDRNLGGRIYFKVSNPSKDIHTDQFIVYINKNDASGVSQTFDTKYFTVTDPSRSWDYFIYDFYSDGDYSISIYTKDYVFINTLSINCSYKQ
jgi:hypothetical protein